MASGHEELRLREDGDYDIVYVDHETGQEAVVRVLPAADKDFPNGRPSAEENEMMNRSEREHLLASTDWWAVSDRTMTQAQKDYRQALRDITTHSNWPNLNSEDWPTIPS